jgi:hypothetical protein
VARNERLRLGSGAMTTISFRGRSYELFFNMQWWNFPVSQIGDSCRVFDSIDSFFVFRSFGDGTEQVVVL